FLTVVVLITLQFLIARHKIFHSSSVVEQSAVNQSVVGSNPTCGAIGEVLKRLKRRPCSGCRSLTRREGSNPSFSATLKWPLGQAVKTPPFHGGNTGSSPVGVTSFIYKTI